MIEETIEKSPKIHRNKLVLFVSGSIVIALVLVSVSLILYASSGAAQLDLSRPGYQSVQDKVEQADKFRSFPSTGAVDHATLDQFRELYDKQVRQVTASDAFSPDALSDQGLGINAPGSDE